MSWNTISDKEAMIKKQQARALNFEFEPNAS